MPIPSLQIASQGLLSGISPTLLEIATQGLMDNGAAPPAEIAGPAAWVNWIERTRRAHEELRHWLDKRKPRVSTVPVVMPARTVFPVEQKPTPASPATAPALVAPEAHKKAAAQKSPLAIAPESYRTGPNSAPYRPMPTVRRLQPLAPLVFPSVPRLATPATPAAEPARFNAMTAAILSCASRSPYAGL